MGSVLLLPKIYFILLFYDFSISESSFFKNRPLLSMSQFSNLGRGENRMENKKSKQVSKDLRFP